jgi:hypothetical protein
LQRATNSLSRKVEITDTQAVACLLGMGPELTTEKFAYFGPNEAANHATAEQSNRRQACDVHSSSDSADDSDYFFSESDDDSEAEFDDVDEVDWEAEAESDDDDDDDDDDKEPINPTMLLQDVKNWNLGPSGTYKIDEGETRTNLPVRYNDHFAFRGEYL